VIVWARTGGAGPGIQGFLIAHERSRYWEVLEARIFVGMSWFFSVRSTGLVRVIVGWKSSLKECFFLDEESQGDDCLLEEAFQGQDYTQKLRL